MKKKLENINFKTLLIYPPNKIEKDSFYNVGVPYGISVIAGFLKNEGYNDVKLVHFFKKKNFILQKIKSTIRTFSPQILGIVTKVYNLIINNNNINDLDKTIGIKEVVELGFYENIKKNIELETAIEITIKKNKPKLIGFSVSYHSQLYFALQMSKIIKKIDDNIVIVLGGSLITKKIHHLIKKRFITAIIDGFIFGPGEESFAELIKLIKNKKKSFSKVPNFYYKVSKQYKKSKEIIKKKKKNLKVIPLFDKVFFEYYDFIPIVVSSGCYWNKCTFCAYNLKKDKQFIILEPDEVVDMMKLLKKNYGLKFFSFKDDALPPVFLKRMSELIIKEKIKVSWSCLVCLDDKFLDSNLTKLMSKAGCKFIGTGFESNSPRIIRLMNKIQKLKNVKKILESFKEAKIKVYLATMFGFPTETKKEAMQTITFLKNNNDLFYWISSQAFSLEENTPIYCNPSAYKIRSIKKMDEIIYKGCEFETEKGMNEEEIKSFVEAAKALNHKK